MVASRATRTGMPYFFAWLAVCCPMHMPTMREKSVSSPTEETKPFTVEAEVKVTSRPSVPSTAARSSRERGLSYTVR